MAEVLSRRPTETLVCDLGSAAARDPSLVGAKAAALARSRHAGLPVVPGFALTTAVHRRFLASGRRLDADTAEAVVASWDDLTGGAGRVVVRSSSTVEDVGTSSMAGQFRSVLAVEGRDRLLGAVEEVLRSGDAVGTPGSPSAMGVLVQRHLDPAKGGVMFGVDPVTGDARRIVVEAVAGGPDQLVSGRVTAQHYVMSRHGRLRELDHRPVSALRPGPRDDRLLGPTELIALARLAARTRRVFGAAQDVEWALEADGTLVLLQSRPVTAVSPVADHGPVLGPGPLAETFPDPLSRLEQDLWVRPLRDGLVRALGETRAVSARRLRESGVVTTVDGRLAADLELFGYVRHRTLWSVLDPRPAFRSLAAAWRTGLVRAELPQRVGELVAEADAALAGVDVAAASDEQLLDAVALGADLLARLHHDEVLAGTLLPAGSASAAALALRVRWELGEPAAGSLADPASDAARAVRRHPVLLCLTAPAIFGEQTLPPAPLREPRPASAALGPREALRLRVRWAQELAGRACRELDRRLWVRGVLPYAGAAALLDLDELRGVVGGDPFPGDVHDRRARELAEALSTPLPAEFRLGPDGSVVPVARHGARPGAGVPAGGGRGSGPVTHGSVRRPPNPGDVLVVRDLEPGLAPYLPGLGGLVAETGSTLSHLAILARENHVPTVVAVHEALRRFPEGARLLVDGSTGELHRLDPAEKETNDEEAAP